MQEPPESIGWGGWSEFCQLLEIARPEYRDFLVELGFGPFLSFGEVLQRDLHTSWSLDSILQVAVSSQ